MEQQDFLSRMDRTTPNSYFHQQHQEPITRETAAPNHQSSTSSLLGVRKTQTKTSKRSPIDPPVPPKVYRVEPRGFRQLVQSLTGSSPSTTATTTTQPPQPTATATAVASSNNSLRLRDAAPAPLHFDLNHQQQRTFMTSFEGVNANSVQFSKSPVPAVVEGGQMMSPIGGLFSPTSLFSAYMAWSSHPVLSPGTMASVDQSNPL